MIEFNLSQTNHQTRAECKQGSRYDVIQGGWWQLLRASWDHLSVVSFSLLLLAVGVGDARCGLTREPALPFTFSLVLLLTWQTAYISYQGIQPPCKDNTADASVIKLKIFMQSIAEYKVKNHLRSVKYGVEHKIITIHE